MSASRNHRLYLEDIRDAIERIARYTAAGRDAFFDNEMMQDAVIRQLSIIGEAASKLPAEWTQRAAEVPWKQVVGMRNILIHEYAGASIARVWGTVHTDLSQLQEAVERLLQEKDGDGTKLKRTA